MRLAVDMVLVSPKGVWYGWNEDLCLEDELPKGFLPAYLWLVMKMNSQHICLFEKAAGRWDTAMLRLPVTTPYSSRHSSIDTGIGLRSTAKSENDYSLRRRRPVASMVRFVIGAPSAFGFSFVQTPRRVLSKTPSFGLSSTCAPDGKIMVTLSQCRMMNLANTSPPHCFSIKAKSYSHFLLHDIVLCQLLREDASRNSSVILSLAVFVKPKG